MKLCKDCRYSADNGDCTNALAETGPRKSGWSYLVYYPCTTMRKDTKCGPDAKLFKAKHPILEKVFNYGKEKE